MLLILVLGATLSAPALPLTRTVLAEETVGVPRSQFRLVHIPLSQRPATIECDFQVKSGASVRALVMTRADVDRLRKNDSYRILAATPVGNNGSLRYPVNRPGEYVLLLDNQSETRDRSTVAFKLSLAFDPAASFTPKTLPAARRNAVTAGALAALSIVAAFSVWRIRAAWARRNAALPD